MTGDTGEGRKLQSGDPPPPTCSYAHCTDATPPHLSLAYITIYTGCRDGGRTHKNPGIKGTTSKFSSTAFSTATVILLFNLSHQQHKASASLQLLSTTGEVNKKAFKYFRIHFNSDANHSLGNGTQVSILPTLYSEP
ncbi:hypothetical protein EWB00_001633 [Schistosoma japonicum]|uniref:Uncharacterized protein n=1 Tax=Schistosoma japonicum TaxID=6182 RepID=A0A4Z2CKM1_SCHJA|nr:hypothetical protein EWB00_001633 [Schistosoma japonicum]